MLALFSLSVFLSAGLLFLLQPMMAKWILPLLGGSPAVWNTCMVFFQILLLAGYLYSHFLSKIRRPIIQAAIHIAVVAAAFIALPLSLPAGWTAPTGDESPIPSLLRLLALSAGLPYFAVSTTGPLLQRWFSRTGHRHSHDPYFLYAASNAGSLVGLLGYPLIIEPTIRLHQQGAVWTAGYAAFAAGLALCAILAARAARRAGPAMTLETPEAPPLLLEDPAVTSTRLQPVTLRRRLMWVVLSAAPSSLMLGVTNHITTDIAPVPLMWVIPIALYLLTLTLAFSPRVKVRTSLLSNIATVLILAVAATMVLRMQVPLFPLVILHLGAFFTAAWMCHTRLAHDRPDPAHLTDFYLCMAVGGALGGCFNGLLAPIAFNQLVEYPTALLAVILLRPRRSAPPPVHASESFPTPTSTPTLAPPPNPEPALTPAPSPVPVSARESDLWLQLAALVPAIGLAALAIPPRHLLKVSALQGGWGTLGLALAVGAVMWFIAARSRLALAIGAAIMLAAPLLREGQETGRLLYRERTFFGISSVYERPHGGFRSYRHGTTMHGMQCFIDQSLRLKPLSYYYPTGPIGHLFDTFWDDPRFDHCAVVGLGAGTLAAYGKSTRDITFFEIDPASIRIAVNPDYFTFIEDSDSAIRIVRGDGRLQIARVDDGAFGFIILDAFTSDAVPVHLLTREAVQIYLNKLSPHGLLLFNVSNWYLDLTPVLAGIADDLHLAARVAHDEPTTPQEIREGKSACIWMIMARTEEDLGPLATTPAWERPEPRPGARIWTDDYSNIFSVMRGW